ncbi:hypothetical protein OCH239_17170 [Roseivivax halodurans JCM 10272]|uniref:Uncharacterized protein n=1 Tax=Roseivivax halodurans JCM 10272 TaxID=1449350 RepID=X7E9Y2_9RHOB|nr:hypothetical protein OCH239_17170 [Roseivivax halodurans JCM 10272]
MFRDQSLALCQDHGFSILRHGPEAERFVDRWRAEADPRGAGAEPEDIADEDPSFDGPEP